jgi:hypothetical protein
MTGSGDEQTQATEASKVRNALINGHQKTFKDHDTR